MGMAASAARAHLPTLHYHLFPHTSKTEDYMYQRKYKTHDKRLSQSCKVLDHCRIRPLVEILTAFVVVSGSMFTTRPCLGTHLTYRRQFKIYESQLAFCNIFSSLCQSMSTYKFKSFQMALYRS